MATVATAPALLMEQKDGIATITINRPWVRNCFTMEMWHELRELTTEVAGNPDIRVLVIQGAGDEAFTSGSDIKEFATMPLEAVNDNFQVLEDALTAVENLPIPTIACLNGYALGGGLELALACDLRIASERATMGMPIARLGVMISPKFAKRIVDLIGPSRAKDLLYTGRLVGASEAHSMGMINYFVLSHELKRTTADIARRIANNSAASVRTAKETVALCLPISEASADRRPYFIDIVDFPEGVAAFLEKRSPNFRHTM
ncbi:MAG TPA: enoyl-CoA hydratase-related protein [Symbiobacteriaceae bacterium]|nr:enoyl-CoA hydratase-related protein [Symbiobacteriaceae bacterium]